VRYAIKTAPQHTTYADMLDVWRVADGIDLYESAWTFDHFEPIFSDRTGPCLEGWITLAALAQATTRLRVGVLVTGMPYRHPSVLANMAATLDVVSDGRLELGLGAGWNQDEADALGIELPPLKERFDRFDEGLEVVIALLSNEVSDYDGRYFQLRQARCEPKPVQRPHPPIVIGGTGPKRTLPAVARHADHWNHPGASP
jgi:F420-dependent oxidoreductase-like protein